MAAGPATNSSVGNFFLAEEVFQVELHRALTEGSSTQLLELKLLSVKPIFQPSKVFNHFI
jgi:hypothetical protein